MITFEQGVELVWRAFDDMEGGEIYVRKIPSMKMTDLAKTLMPNGQLDHVGIRPGDASFTFEYNEYFKYFRQ